MKVIRAISALFALAGLIVLGFAFDSYHTQAAFIAEASPAEGVVTAVIAHRSSSSAGSKPRSTTFYTFRIRFRPPGGDTVEAEAMETGSSPWWPEGTPVPVLYARGKPTRFNIDDFSMLWGDTVILAILGGCLFGAGAVAFYIAGGRSPKGVRTEAKLAEVARAWRAGRLTRDSEFQGLLIGFTYTGFFLLGGALSLALLAPLAFALLLATCAGFVAYAIRRSHNAKPPESRRK